MVAPVYSLKQDDSYANFLFDALSIAYTLRSYVQQAYLLYADISFWLKQSLTVAWVQLFSLSFNEEQAGPERKS